MTKLPRRTRSRQGSGSLLGDLLDAAEGKAPSRPVSKPAKAQGSGRGDPWFMPTKQIVTPLGSTYFVQCDGDVRSLRSLAKDLAKVNVGISTNADSIIDLPRIDKLVSLYLDEGAKVYVDSGVYPRFVRKQGSPDFDRVMELYAQLAERASGDGQVSVTAPDIIGDSKGTLALQRRYSRVLRRLASDRRCRLVVPVQGGDARSVARGILDAMDRFPGCYVGLPVRTKNTTPMIDLVQALLIVGAERGGGPDSLPPIHFLGLGSSKRMGEHVTRVAAIYRVLSGPKVWEITAARQSPNLLTKLLRAGDGPQRDMAEWIASRSVKDMQRLAGCVMTRDLFPCPPYPWNTQLEYGKSHPAVDAALRLEWETCAGERANWPAERLINEPDLNVDGDLLFLPAKRDGEAVRYIIAYTEKVTGIPGLGIDWGRFLVEQWDAARLDVSWNELCLSAIEDAEGTDPAMVEGWGEEALDKLVESGGAHKIQVDATTVSIAASLGVWIVDGVQRAPTTPAWWKKEPRAFRFRWNLRETIIDRSRRERLIEYHYPRGYDDKGFY